MATAAVRAIWIAGNEQKAPAASGCLRYALRNFCCAWLEDAAPLGTQR